MKDKNLIMNEHIETAKALGDYVSIGTVVATLAGWLPALAALASLIWTCLRIYETKTVQGWINKE